MPAQTKCKQHINCPLRRLTPLWVSKAAVFTGAELASARGLCKAEVSPLRFHHNERSAHRGRDVAERRGRYNPAHVRFNARALQRL